MTTFLRQKETVYWTNNSTAGNGWCFSYQCNIYNILNYLLLTLGAFSRHSFKNISFPSSIYMSMVGTALQGTDEETQII